MPTRLHYSIVDSITLRNQSLEFTNLKSATVNRRVAEHFEEDGLREVVEEGDGFAALSTEGVRLVEDGGDALLFRQRRLGHREILEVLVMPGVPGAGDVERY